MPLKRLRDLHLPWWNLNTLKSIFRREGYSRLTAVKRPYITKRHAKLRREWFAEYGPRSEYFWRDIVFLDEVMFRQHASQRSVRFSVNRYHHRDIQRTIPVFKTANTGMFLMGIRYGQPPIVVPCPGRINAAEYQRLLCRAFPINQRQIGVTAVMDRAPCHFARSVSFLHFKHVCVYF